MVEQGTLKVMSAILGCVNVEFSSRMIFLCSSSALVWWTKIFRLWYFCGESIADVNIDQIVPLQTLCWTLQGSSQVSLWGFLFVSLSLTMHTRGTQATLTKAHLHALMCNLWTWWHCGDILEPCELITFLSGLKVTNLQKLGSSFVGMNVEHGQVTSPYSPHPIMSPILRQ